MCELNSNDGHMIRHDRQVLAIACGVWLLASALQVLPEGRVSFRGLSAIPLPHACFSRSWLGVKCPGCGLTRSIIQLAQGDWQASWREHRLGALIAIVIALQIPYRIVALRRPDRPLFRLSWQTALGYALIALLLGNWLVDLASKRDTASDSSIFESGADVRIESLARDQSLA
jgi:hypothetical protein